jgi:hypothetical protein
MSTYPQDIDNDSADYSRVQALGRYIALKRGSDIIADAIIYHGDCWWKVLGNGATMESEILYAEKAGSPESSSEEVKISIDEGALYPAALEGSPLQFQDGSLLKELWPCCGLIYVKDARRRSTQADENEKVFGIFALHYNSDGDPYYYPVDQEMQPGVAPNWLLDPKFDLILDWEPVDVADLLNRMQGKSRG